MYKEIFHLQSVEELNKYMKYNNHYILICGKITLGYYGGNSDSGAYKNEDVTVQHRYVCLMEIWCECFGKD